MESNIAKQILKMLKNHYSLADVSLFETQGGWSALAYQVTCEAKDYFLKMYDKHKHTSQSWIRRIDLYMPMLLWLEGNTVLRGKIPSTVLTANGTYRCEDEDFIYLLFHHIDGETLCEKELDKSQIRQLAEIIAELHQVDDTQSIPPMHISENFDVSFCDNLKNDLLRGNASCPVDLSDRLGLWAELLLVKIKELNELAAYLRTCSLKFVLCHTDIHGWNIMQSSQLKLIDWEGIEMAPPEADLFSFSRNFSYDYAREEFMDTYGRIRPNYRENPVAMQFYRLRRRLEDISEFAEGLLHNNLIGEDREVSLKLLEHECSMLSDG